MSVGILLTDPQTHIDEEFLTLGGTYQGRDNDVEVSKMHILNVSELRNEHVHQKLKGEKVLKIKELVLISALPRNCLTDMSIYFIFDLSTRIFMVL